jgi:hypothetical protein
LGENGRAYCFLCSSATELLASFSPVLERADALAGILGGKNVETPLSRAQQGNLYPSGYNCLRSLPDCALHHSDHGLRHPLGIYSLSFGRVVRAFKMVLDENDEIYQTPTDSSGRCNFETTALLTAQRELLDALMAHIDDCYQILKALYPANRNEARKPALFAHQWLSQAKHPTVEFFKDQINPYRETFAPIDNKMKHEHGRLRSIVMRHPALLDVPHIRIAGYFVEGVDSHQTLGPKKPSQSPTKA